MAIQKTITPTPYKKELIALLERACHVLSGDLQKADSHQARKKGTDHQRVA